MHSLPREDYIIRFLKGFIPYTFFPLLKGKIRQWFDHMGLTELLKSNNLQQQSYF